MAAISYNPAELCGLIPGPINFGFIPEIWIQKPLVMEVFVQTGAGLWRYENFAEFEATAWASHYTDEDVERTPKLVRKPLHPLLGYW